MQEGKDANPSRALEVGDTEEIPQEEVDSAIENLKKRGIESPSPEQIGKELE